MPTLPWTEDLELGNPVMDQTHHEFVELLAHARASSDADLPAEWDALIAHTEAHFAHEDAWMQATGFAPTNCHALQHRTILNVLREGAEKAAQGDLTPVKLMLRELAIWFPQHAQSMDAALATHLERVGFDVATGTMTHRPSGEIHGCGGACSA
jgi:hemerythrin-like metal-binding protein